MKKKISEVKCVMVAYDCSVLWAIVFLLPAIVVHYG